ncbi:hypothetical protein N9903_01825 [bacterium]|nr:hypothetical protein [bacterium]
MLYSFFYLNAIIGIAYFIVGEEYPVGRISDILGLAFGLLALLWALWAKGRMNKLLHEKYGKQYAFNLAGTIIFTLWYFNYRINKINHMLYNKSL